LEPGPELQQLEKAILAPDPELWAPIERESAVVTAHQRLPRKPTLVVFDAVLVLGVAVGLVLWLPSHHPASLPLRPNSVGFVDAASGRVVRSFAVGRSPDALVLTNGSLWVANEEDETVIRINLATGRSVVVPVGGHPTGLVAAPGIVWVWTLEHSLVPVDPRFDTAGAAIRLAADVAGTPAGSPAAVGGGVALGGGVRPRRRAAGSSRLSQRLALGGRR
jgi:DNA-binding beta-propeller fold protein YncE